MEDTIFDKIIRKEIPAKIVYEDDDFIVINDVNPQAPIHLLIIPKAQIPTLNDATDEHQLLFGKMILLGKQLAKQYGIADNGYRLVLNVNNDGGQTVLHIHMHLLGGREFGWPPG
ncbi:MAG TPA: histidine triad nucleotide-binding protein [Bacteroidetes bacterium]|nr:histidine triad nucleotide-binding protein [Bacteroidota bacterium]